MSALRVIGVDPGPIPGLVLLEYADGPSGLWLHEAEVLQCTHGLAPRLVEQLVVDRHSPSDLTLVQIERFVVGARAGRSRTPEAGRTTRALISQLNLALLGTDARVAQRSAVQVKPWATDERLAAAGLLDATKGMRHARDAARHALFCAVHAGHVPDPLSRQGAHR